MEEGKEKQDTKWECVQMNYVYKIWQCAPVGILFIQSCVLQSDEVSPPCCCLGRSEPFKGASSLHYLPSPVNLSPCGMFQSVVFFSQHSQSFASLVPTCLQWFADNKFRKKPTVDEGDEIENEIYFNLVSFSYVFCHTGCKSGSCSYYLCLIGEINLFYFSWNCLHVLPYWPPCCLVMFSRWLCNVKHFVTLFYAEWISIIVVIFISLSVQFIFLVEKYFN